MTIPGKGGRPRKWRSDADRSRAYRARQRGGDEPTTIEQALDDGDELAEARREIARLSLALREGRIEQRALRRSSSAESETSCSSTSSSRI